MNKLNKIITLILLCMISSTVSAELNAYMQITGSIQGQIDGEVSSAGRENTFLINEYHHLFTKDSRGGTTHKPLIITTPVSKGIPFLLRAMDTNEILDITIRFYRPTPEGLEINYYTLELNSATISTAEPIMFDNTEPENIPKRSAIRLRFDYRSILHTYMPDREEYQLNVTGSQVKDDESIE